jgi:hypothetical protein
MGTSIPCAQARESGSNRGGKEHRFIALLKQRCHGEIFAKSFAGLGLDSHLKNTFDIPIENVSGQPGLWDYGAKQATQLGHGLKDGGRMTQTGQEAGSSQTFRTTTNNRQATSGLRRLE